MTYRLCDCFPTVCVCVCVDSGLCVCVYMFLNLICVSVSQLVFLPPPWGNCKMNSPDSDFFSAYSLSACRIDCETRYLVENCNCRMVHMPGRPWNNANTQNVSGVELGGLAPGSAVRDIGLWLAWPSSQPYCFCTHTVRDGLLSDSEGLEAKAIT